MTKGDLVKKVQEALSISTQKEAAEKLDKFVEVLAEVIKSGEELTLGDLGKFEIVTRAERTCRNPQTGEQMKVPAKKAVKFKPSSKMKKAVNE